MGVIYIGDRATGKTHLAMELANPEGNFVKVTHPDYEVLKSQLYIEEKGSTRPTSDEQAIYERYLEVQVKLPTRIKEITLDWLDTPGEIWRKTWRFDYPEKWKNFLENIKKSEGIFLIIPPYRDIIKKKEANPDDFITKVQWCNRFTRWAEFFRQDCPKIRHLIVCLNKADLLFCDHLELKEEARKLAYMTWQERDRYVFQKYFRPIHSQIEYLNSSIRGLSVRSFITSIYSRKLLELPWIYLGTYLEKENW